MLKRLKQFSVFILALCGLVFCNSKDAREQDYLNLIRDETVLIKSYQQKGYLSYLAEQNQNLPKRIAKKNKCVKAMNASYAEMDQSEKTRYIEVWRPEFSKAWQEYADAFDQLKAAAIPQDESQNFELQRLEKLWQTTMDAQEVVSPDAPLFSVSGD